MKYKINTTKVVVLLLLIILVPLNGCSGSSSYRDCIGDCLTYTQKCSPEFCTMGLCYKDNRCYTEDMEICISRCSNQGELKDDENDDTYYLDYIILNRVGTS